MQQTFAIYADMLLAGWGAEWEGGETINLVVLSIL